MKNKGFTLVELLATIAILAILLVIGVMAVSNIFDNSKETYYKSQENTLGIAGNEYFNDNREDRPIDDYAFVDLKTLQEHEYLEELKTYDGKSACDPTSGVYLYNDNGNKYETCLICGDYQSDGPFCGGHRTDTIIIKGIMNPSGDPYNPLLSYSGSSWVNATSVTVTFSLEGKESGLFVSKYEVYDSVTSQRAYSCNASGNTCSVDISVSGSYYVEAFGTQEGHESEGIKKVAPRKFFNVKLDNTSPSYEIKNGNEEIILKDDEIEYEYENEVVNINDDNGYSTVSYMLIRYNPMFANAQQIMKEETDIKDKDLKIREKLPSGKYTLLIKVKDFAGNSGKCTNCTGDMTLNGEKFYTIIFYIKYNVILQFFDVYNTKHDVGSLKVFTYGKYEQLDSSGNLEKSLPDKINLGGRTTEEIAWHKDANFAGSSVTSNSIVNSTGYHVLYGKESRKKTSFTSKCIKKSDGGNLVYNRKDQKLVTDGVGYNLVTYFGGKKANNFGHDAGTYTIIAELDPIYEWDDGTVSNKYVECEIEKAPVTLPGCKNPTYNGYYQELISGAGVNMLYHDAVPPSIPHDAEHNTYANTGEIDYTVTGPFGKNARDDYKVKFHLVNNNYKWSDNTRDDKELTCSIGKKSTAIVWGTTTTFTYNGGEQAPSASAAAALSYYTIKLNITKEIDKGDYTSTATCNNVGSSLKGEGDLCSNYTFTNTTKNYKINPKSVAVSWGSTTTFTYDGSSHAPTASVTTGVSGETMNVTRTTETDAGTYTSTASCSSVTGGRAKCSNYTLTNTTKGYTINPMKVTIPTATAYCQSLTYTGGELTLTKSSPTGVSFSNNKRTNAGSQTVTASLTSKKNYRWNDSAQSTSNKTFDCSIAKKSLSVSWGSTTTFTYDGSSHAPDASVATGVSGETMNVSRTTATDAGTHTSTASCSSVTGGQASCNNYSLSNTTKSFTINPVYVTIPTAAAYCNTLTYTGSQQTLAKAAPTGVTFSNNTRTNAGSQTVTASLSNTTNYKWNDATYSTSNKTFDCSIGTKSVTVTWGTTTEFNEDGNAHAPDASVDSTGITGETMSVTRTTATDAGDYTSTASCSSVTGGQASCSNYTLSGNTKDFKIKSNEPAFPSSVSSCSKYYYKFTYQCHEGTTLRGKGTQWGPYNNTSSNVSSNCSTAKSNFSCGGSNLTTTTGSCTTGVSWGIYYMLSNGSTGSSCCYSSRDAAVTACGNSNYKKCAVTCG